MDEPAGFADTTRAANPALIGLNKFLATCQNTSLEPVLLRSIGVAYSGGADSTALLIAAAQRWPGQVHAIHIHHGLQAAANHFAHVCEFMCAGLSIPFHLVHVDAGHASGESPEDAARRARYRALANQAIHANLCAVLLGQHADDQIETLLLALSRGAGLPGLSSMSGQFCRHGVQFYRPLLQTPAAALREWLVVKNIVFVDDPTNIDERFTRNRIRARILPILADTFPQFRETFARSAQHAAQAQALLLEFAVQDLAIIGSPPTIRKLQALSQQRQANVLRYWFLTQETTPSTAQLEELLKQIKACTTRGHRINLKVGGGHVIRAIDVLSYTLSVRIVA